MTAAKNPNTWTIGQVALMAGIRPHDIDLWFSRANLSRIVPARTDRAWRRFSRDEACRIVAVAALKKAGMRLDAAIEHTQRAWGAVPPSWPMEVTSLGLMKAQVYPPTTMAAVVLT